MGNLNAEQIKKALEHCIKDSTCEQCPQSPFTCHIQEDALALIKSQEQRIEAYRQELAEVRVALAEANNDKKKLTEENAKLARSCTELTQECKKWQSRLKIECEYTKADTVRKMQELVRKKIKKTDWLNGRAVYVEIDQIANELLKEDQK